MRLLHAKPDGSFGLTTFLSNNTPSYAILSHRWESNDQEVTFEDVTNGTGKGKQGYRKIQFCHEQARKDGLHYFWVDSCAIDKSSSAELSEAINSMFRWYQNAVKCYVYLSDVSTGKHSRSSELLWESAFSRSLWFTRGWTLQELLAPPSVEFFSREGMRLGDKQSLENQIQQITGIPIQALRRDLLLQQFSVEERMSWTENRETTREEDQAYCLMGIFDVYLPIIYGEGANNAQKRLREAINKQSEEQKCLQALRTSEYERFKKRNPDRLKGTCQWFLQHDHFKQWQESTSSGLLWVSADPGCGKSVLSKSLVDEDLKSTESRTTCYFFFKDDDKHQKSVANALSAVLHQLFSQRKSLIHHAIPQYCIEGNQLPQQFHKLWSILMNTGADAKAGEIICVLDALDECEEAGRYEIISSLKDFYKTATSSQRRQSRLKFLVTSRPYFDIERRFAELTRDIPTIRLRGERETEAISHEINIVIKWEVQQLGVELDLNDSEQSSLEGDLLGITHRTYLWLKLIMDVIRGELKFTKKKQKQIIGSLPNTIEDAYEAILSKSRDKEQTWKLLHLVVAATRPLSLKEMNIALAIEDHHRSYEDLDLEGDARFETTVRNVCGLFVSVIDQKVYLIHQTAKEFLIAKGEALGGRWKYSIDPVHSELLMATSCITYLMFTVFDELDVMTAGSKSTFLWHPFLDYAACFWSTHYRRAQEMASDKILQLVLHICNLRSPRYHKWFLIYWTTFNPYELAPHFTSSMMLGSYLGHEVVVKLLLATSQEDINSKDRQFSRTPLSWAAENGHVAVVQLLLATVQVDVNAKDFKDQTPLSRAAQNGHETTVQVLLATGKADINSKDKQFDQTPLLWAAMKGHEAIVRLLLSTGQADVNSADNWDRRTPLSWAAQNGHDAVVQLLLATGRANINPNYWHFDRTPLSYAAGSGYEAIVQLLLSTDQADVNSTDDDGRTPLSWAAGKGHKAVVRLLLATGKADVNLTDVWYGRTPLSWAAENGHEAVVQLLLSTDQADVNSKDDDGRTPLSLAAENGHDAVVQLLLATGQVDVNAKDGLHGQTPLSWAAENGHTAVVQLLLSTHQADVNLTDDESRPLLSWAAEKGHEAVVQLLLATGQADLDSKDKLFGRTPLLWAAAKKHEAVVKIIQSFSSL